jgi:PilZ domain
MSGRDEKRQADRIQPFVAPCRYVVEGQRVPAFLTDLSTRGARVHGDLEPPAVDAHVTLEVRLGLAATHQRIPAAVEWSQASPRGGFVFGLSFDGIGPGERSVLEGVVEEFRRRAAAIE